MYESNRFDNKIKYKIQNDCKQEQKGIYHCFIVFLFFVDCFKNFIVLSSIYERRMKYDFSFIW